MAVARACGDLGAVGVEQLHGERAVAAVSAAAARLEAEAVVVVQQHVRVGVVHRVRKVRRVARRLVPVQLRQLLRGMRTQGLKIQGPRVELLAPA